jgi:TfoX/Sxy family transcriptional regulator of competence genes
VAAAMAYDEDLAHRVRELLAGQTAVTEKAMFGGLAFMLQGNMSVAVSSRGGLMVRVGADAADEALSRPHTRPVEMAGRQMRGWVRVSREGVKTKRQLSSWVRRGVAAALSLPAKGA